MTHVTTGRPFRSHASEALSRMFLNTPSGWTLCGIIGLLVILHPRLALLATYLDFSVREKQHCYLALMRSIERSSNEAHHDRHHRHLQE